MDSRPPNDTFSPGCLMAQMICCVWWFDQINFCSCGVLSIMVSSTCALIPRFREQLRLLLDATRCCQDQSGSQSFGRVITNLAPSTFRFSNINVGLFAFHFLIFNTCHLSLLHFTEFYPWFNPQMIGF